MTKPTGNPRGRPAVPAHKRAVVKTFSIPADEWLEVEDYIPEGERSRLIRDWLKAEVKRRKAAKSVADPDISGESLT